MKWTLTDKRITCNHTNSSKNNKFFFGKKKKKILTVKIENPRAREEQDTTLYESEADFSLMDWPTRSFLSLEYLKVKTGCFFG